MTSLISSSSASCRRFVVLAWAPFLLVASGVEAASAKPYVLFLCVDDMKDWVNRLGGYEGQKSWRQEVGADPMRPNPEYQGESK